MQRIFLSHIAPRNKKLNKSHAESGQDNLFDFRDGKCQIVQFPRCQITRIDQGDFMFVQKNNHTSLGQENQFKFLGMSGIEDLVWGRNA